MSQSAFTLRGRNPDVLSCIANLSNDEVFTPPEFANRMLDTLAEAWAADNEGANIWADPSVRFLDPCTKSGVFLREITKRLIDGLEPQMPELQACVDHILTRQVYGIGITELTAMLARRSLYCSKHANGPHSISRGFNSETGNVWFERVEHTWEKPNEENKGKCTFCGASSSTLDRGDDRESHAYAFIHTDNIQERVSALFGDDMQFDVIIGNPPYQIGDGGGGGGASATPIYNLFIESALALEPRYTIMITPSRWFSGGKGLDEFRDRMLSDKRFQKLIDFPQLYDVFPGVKIRGGLSYWLWAREYSGDCEVTTMIGDEITGTPTKRPLNDYDVFVRRNEAVQILDKVSSFRVEGQKEPNLGARVSARKPFGLTNERGVNSKKDLEDPILVFSNQHQGYLEKKKISNNHDWINLWKVLLVKAHGTSGREDVTILGKPIVAGPGTACTETYLVIDKLESEQEAQNLAAFMGTRFVRFLVSLRKITQNITRDTYNFVPALPMDRSWSDDDLYKRYDLTDSDISFIESLISAPRANLLDNLADD